MHDSALVTPPTHIYRRNIKKQTQPFVNYETVARSSKQTPQGLALNQHPRPKFQEESQITTPWLSCASKAASISTLPVTELTEPIELTLASLGETACGVGLC